MKVGVNILHAIQYKYWMMGIPISRASCFNRDNMLTSKLASTLKEKCNELLIMMISAGLWQ